MSVWNSTRKLKLSIVSFWIKMKVWSSDDLTVRFAVNFINSPSVEFEAGKHQDTTSVNCFITKQPLSVGFCLLTWARQVFLPWHCLLRCWQMAIVLAGWTMKLIFAQCLSCPTKLHLNSNPSRTGQMNLKSSLSPNARSSHLAERKQIRFFIQKVINKNPFGRALSLQTWEKQ